MAKILIAVQMDKKVFMADINLKSHSSDEMGRRLYLISNSFDLSDRCRVICKNDVWGPVEWVGDQLIGWGGSSQKQNLKKMRLVFFYFFYLSIRYRDIFKNGVWGPVEWVGDQLTG